FGPIRRPGRFRLFPSRLSGFTRQHRREVQFELEVRLHVVRETPGLLAAPSRSGLRPSFSARPIHCSAFRHSECLTSLADVGPVGSEVARLVALALATVRRSNCTCSFPAYSFHEDSHFRGAIVGIN